MVGHSTSSTPLKVLVVEDAAAVRRRMVGELSDMPEVGEIVETGDKAAAMTALNAGLPDVVILDVQLPDGSGLDLLRGLRDSGSPSAVILFSNLTARPLADGCAELKPDFVFHKSADFEDVKAAVRRLGGAAAIPRNLPLSPARAGLTQRPSTFPNLRQHHETKPPAPHRPRRFHDHQFRAGPRCLTVLPRR